MAYRAYTFTFASAATGTNKIFVGNHETVTLVASAMTNWNSSTGNATVQIRGGLSATDTHGDIGPSMSVATMGAKSVWVFPNPGLPFMSIGLGSIPTGSATNTIDVLVYSTNT